MLEIFLVKTVRHTFPKEQHLKYISVNVKIHKIKIKAVRRISVEAELETLSVYRELI